MLGHGGAFGLSPALLFEMNSCSLSLSLSLSLTLSLSRSLSLSLPLSLSLSLCLSLCLSLHWSCFPVCASSFFWLVLDCAPSTSVCISREQPCSCTRAHPVPLHLPLIPSGVGRDYCCGADHRQAQSSVPTDTHTHTYTHTNTHTHTHNCAHLRFPKRNLMGAQENTWWLCF